MALTIPGANMAEMQNGQARTDIARLQEQAAACHQRQAECQRRTEALCAQLEERVTMMERQMVAWRVYGTLAAVVLTGVVGPLVTALMLRALTGGG